jgi:hypothetical protein
LVKRKILETTTKEIAYQFFQSRSTGRLFALSGHLFVFTLSFAGASTSKQAWTPYSVGASHTRQNTHLCLIRERDENLGRSLG